MVSLFYYSGSKCNKNNQEASARTSLKFFLKVRFLTLIGKPNRKIYLFLCLKIPPIFNCFELYLDERCI